MNLSTLSQAITQHALTGPAEQPNRGIVRNSLSPHFDRLVQELVRAHVIKTTQAAQARVVAECTEFKQFLNPQQAALLDTTVARINAILQDLTK